jgi:hypothetical protein
MITMRCAEDGGDFLVPVNFETNSIRLAYKALYSIEEKWYATSRSSIPISNVKSRIMQIRVGFTKHFTTYSKNCRVFTFILILPLSLSSRSIFF